MKIYEVYQQLGVVLSPNAHIMVRQDSTLVAHGRIYEIPNNILMEQAMEIHLDTFVPSWGRPIAHRMEVWING